MVAISQEFCFGGKRQTGGAEAVENPLPWLRAWPRAITADTVGTSIGPLSWKLSFSHIIYRQSQLKVV